VVDLTLSRGSGFSFAVNLSLPERGLTAVLGPSGCGKTTLLRCIAGLEPSARGCVIVKDQAWQNSARSLFIPTWKRPIGYVFQEASLFEHLNVRRNLEFGLRRVRAPQARAVLDEAIELLGIGALLHRRPDGLSGGERQRVAIARALATQPELLLLDEPLAALDEARKQEVLPWLDSLRRQSSVPMLYVTHSQAEALRLADRVIRMDRGRIVQVHEDALATLSGEHAVVEGIDELQHRVQVLLDGVLVWMRLGRDQRLPQVGDTLSVRLQPVAGPRAQ
jgi:molybdate transport system ATP-binding protein